MHSKSKSNAPIETANNVERGNEFSITVTFRWHNHLDPMVRKSPWNESEEFVFISAHKIYGNRWAEIAKMIPGRYDIVPHHLNSENLYLK